MIHLAAVRARVHLEDEAEGAQADGQPAAGHRLYVEGEHPAGSLSIIHLFIFNLYYDNIFIQSKAFL